MNELTLVAEWRRELIGVYRCLGDDKKALQTAFLDSSGLNSVHWLLEVAAVHRDRGRLDSSDYYLTKAAMTLNSVDNDNSFSNKDRSVTQLQIAINAFARGRFEQSLGLIQSIQVDSTVDVDWKLLYEFYLGACNTKAGSQAEGLRLMASSCDSMAIYEHQKTCLQIQGELLAKAGKECIDKAKRLAEEAKTRSKGVHHVFY